MKIPKAPPEPLTIPEECESEEASSDLRSPTVSSPASSRSPHIIDVSAPGVVGGFGTEAPRLGHIMSDLEYEGDGGFKPTFYSMASLRSSIKARSKIQQDGFKVASQTNAGPQFRRSQPFMPTSLTAVSDE